MERVTYVKCPIWWNKGRNPTPYTSRQTRQVVCDRLGQIEDILGDEYDLDRLRELVQADREGRCVVLPKEEILKKGDKVWYCDKETAEIESGTVVSAFYKNGKLESFSVDFDSGDFDEFVGSVFGTCFFKSCEAAEAAIVGTRVI